VWVIQKYLFSPCPGAVHKRGEPYPDFIILAFGTKVHTVIHCYTTCNFIGGGTKWRSEALWYGPAVCRPIAAIHIAFGHRTNGSGKVNTIGIRRQTGPPGCRLILSNALYELRCCPTLFCVFCDENAPPDSGQTMERTTDITKCVSIR